MGEDLVDRKQGAFVVAERGDVVRIEIFHVEDAAHRQVGQHHAEGDREQQQRLEFFHDRQIEQNHGDQDHAEAVQGHVGKTGASPEIGDGVAECVDDR